MKSKMGICKRVRWLAMNQPLILPSIINDPRYDKRITKGILRDLIPRRTSIEIECIGNLSVLTNTPKRKMSGKYKVLSLDCQDSRGLSIIIDYNEHAISIANYTQLTGLYNVLADMKKYCTLNESSGCHIHVDLSKLYNGSSTSLFSQIEYKYGEGGLMTKLRDFLTDKCRDGTIEKIFGVYTPSMMTQKLCDIDYKIAWVNIRSNFASVEFRTAPMTFDYHIIVKWFVEVNKLLNEFENIEASRRKS